MESLSMLYEQLDKLKAGVLPAAEKTALVQKYHADADFRKEVHFYLAMQQVVIADFEREMAKVNRADMNRWYEEAKKAHAFRKKVIYSGIVAVFILLLVGIWQFYPSKNANCPENITQYYAASLVIDAKTMGVNVPKPSSETDLQKIGDLYAQGKYEEAIKSISILEKVPENQRIATLHLALSELQLQQSDKALQHLGEYEAMLTQEERTNSSLTWWKLMAYYQKGEKQKAMSLANEIMQKKQKHQKEVKELLPCLE